MRTVVSMNAMAVRCAKTSFLQKNRPSAYKSQMRTCYQKGSYDGFSSVDFSFCSFSQTFFGNQGNDLQQPNSATTLRIPTPEWINVIIAKIQNSVDDSALPYLSSQRKAYDWWHSKQYLQCFNVNITVLIFFLCSIYFVSLTQHQHYYFFQSSQTLGWKICI